MTRASKKDIDSEAEESVREDSDGDSEVEQSVTPSMKSRSKATQKPMKKNALRPISNKSTSGTPLDEEDETPAKGRKGRASGNKRKYNHEYCLTCQNYGRACGGRIEGEDGCTICRGPLKKKGEKLRECLWADPAHGINTYQEAREALKARKIATKAVRGKRKRRDQISGENPTTPASALKSASSPFSDGFRPLGSHAAAHKQNCFLEEDITEGAEEHNPRVTTPRNDSGVHPPKLIRLVVVPNHPSQPQSKSVNKVALPQSIKILDLLPPKVHSDSHHQKNQHTLILSQSSSHQDYLATEPQSGARVPKHVHPSYHLMFPGQEREVSPPTFVLRQSTEYPTTKGMPPGDTLACSGPYTWTTRPTTIESVHGVQWEAPVSWKRSRLAREAAQSIPPLSQAGTGTTTTTTSTSQSTEPDDCSLTITPQDHTSTVDVFKDNREIYKADSRGRLPKKRSTLKTALEPLFTDATPAPPHAHPPRSSTNYKYVPDAVYISADEIHETNSDSKNPVHVQDLNDNDVTSIANNTAQSVTQDIVPVSIHAATGTTTQPSSSLKRKYTRKSDSAVSPTTSEPVSTTRGPGRPSKIRRLEDGTQVLSRYMSKKLGLPYVAQVKEVTTTSTTLPEKGKKASKRIQQQKDAAGTSRGGRGRRSGVSLAIPSLTQEHADIKGANKANRSIENSADMKSQLSDATSLLEQEHGEHDFNDNDAEEEKTESDANARDEDYDGEENQLEDEGEAEEEEKDYEY